VQDQIIAYNESGILTVTPGCNEKLALYCGYSISVVPFFFAKREFTSAQFKQRIAQIPQED
jgi:hypothetical protein